MKRCIFLIFVATFTAMAQQEEITAVTTQSSQKMLISADNKTLYMAASGRLDIIDIPNRQLITSLTLRFGNADSPKDICFHPGLGLLIPLGINGGSAPSDWRTALVDTATLTVRYLDLGQPSVSCAVADDGTIYFGSDSTTNKPDNKLALVNPKDSKCKEDFSYQFSN